MSEQLGDAVLVLRTDDTALVAGVAGAKSKSQDLGRTLDATSGSSTRLGKALAETGVSAAMAGAKAEESARDVARLNNAMAATSGGAVKFAAAQTGVTQANGAQRAGLIQLQQNFSDVTTMYALGARPAQIFASQIGQITQAVQLAAGGGSKFAAFLGGPWGMAITTAVVVLGPLISKLLETENAMEKVEFASNAVSDAQGILGNVMDLTTGKINTQNQALIALARAQLLVAQIQSRARATEAKQSIVESAGRDLTAGGGAANVIRFLTDNTNPQVRSLSDAFVAGKTSADAAVKALSELQKEGKITESQFNKLAVAYANYGVETENQKVYQEGLDLLNGTGGTSLLKPVKEKKTRSPSGKSAEDIAAGQAKEIERLGLEELHAKLDLATDADERADLSHQILAAEKLQRIDEVKANKDFSAEQKKAQIAYIERLYGTSKIGPDGTIEVTPSLYGTALDRKLQEEEARLANDMLQRQARTLDAWADIEPNTRERAKLEEAALKLHQQIEQNLLEQSIASGDVADAEAAQAELAKQQEAARRRLALQNMSPGQRYVYDLKTSAANIDDAVEQIGVNGLQAFNDQLVDALVNFKSLGDVAHSVLQQILADLLRLAIQKAITAPLAGMLFGGGGGSGLSISSADNAAFAGMFASGGLIPSGSFGIVGEAGPEPIFATSGGVGVLPNSALRRMETGGGNSDTFISNYNIAERANPRTTRSAIARGQQLAMARASRKGLAPGVSS